MDLERVIGRILESSESRKVLALPDVDRRGLEIESNRDLCRMYGIDYVNLGREAFLRARAVAYIELYQKKGVGQGGC